MMEAVKRQLRITSTAFHTTYKIPMMRYSPPPFGISTTACQIASFKKTLSRNNVCTKSATISHFF